MQIVFTILSVPVRLRNSTFTRSLKRCVSIGGGIYVTLTTKEMYFQYRNNCIAIINDEQKEYKFSSRQ